MTIRFLRADLWLLEVMVLGPPAGCVVLLGVVGWLLATGC